MGQWLSWCWCIFIWCNRRTDPIYSSILLVFVFLSALRPLILTDINDQWLVVPFTLLLLVVIHLLYWPDQLLFSQEILVLVRELEWDEGSKVEGSLCDLLTRGFERKEKSQQVSNYRTGRWNLGIFSQRVMWVCLQSTCCLGNNHW